MKVTVSYEPEEKSLASVLIRLLVHRLHKHRLHETEKSGRRVVYFTTKGRS